MTISPEPHPLDFDWRFDLETSSRLFKLVADLSPILCLGTPTVARMLEQSQKDVELVDRQPCQGVRRHHVSEVAEFQSGRRFHTALLDPPWYPDEALIWAAIAARAVGTGGSVFMSLWPVRTRPSAGVELANLIGELRKWGDVTRIAADLRYQIPLFELASSQHSDGALSQSPRSGELLRLIVHSVPDQPKPNRYSSIWKRFVLNDYQLAIRTSKTRGPSSLKRVSTADGWIWPFVSRRAPGRDQIDLWSSRGEVAIMGSTESLTQALHNAIQAPDTKSFERALEAYPDLLSWQIPRPPFRRVIEWSHRQ